MKKKWLLIIGILVLFVVWFVIVFFLNKNELKDTSWSLNGWYITYKSLDKNDITLNFSKDKVVGSGGVNSYGGEYELGAKNKITIKNIISTEMASQDPEVNKVESTYFRLLTEVKYYKISMNKLIFYNAEGNDILIFVK